MNTIVLQRACHYLNEDRRAHMEATGVWRLDPGKLEMALEQAGVVSLNLGPDKTGRIGKKGR